MNEQYGNSGYNRVEENPYNQRDNEPQGNRYNNFVDRRYDEGGCMSSYINVLML
jgi:hypothetical protein